MKKCGMCLETKPLSDFYKNRVTKTGRSQYCILCAKLYNKNNAEKISASRKKCYHKKRGIRVEKMSDWHSSINGRARRLHESAKRRAKKKGILFDLNLSQIFVLLLMGKCQRSGIEFDLKNRQETVMNPFAPSLDRINNSKGYTPDNIQLVCNLYNMGKGQNTDQEFIDFCRKVIEHNERNK